jgi:hypothetical protein
MQARRKGKVYTKVQKKNEEMLSGLLTAFAKKNLLKHDVEDNMEGTRRRGRRHKQLMNKLKEKIRY